MPRRVSELFGHFSPDESEDEDALCVVIDAPPPPAYKKAKLNYKGWGCPECDAAFARMMAAHPNATVIGGATAVAAPEDRCEFPERSEAEQKEADAAFEKLLAQNPEAKEILPGVYATAPN